MCVRAWTDIGGQLNAERVFFVDFLLFSSLLFGGFLNLLIYRSAEQGVEACRSDWLVA